MLQETLYPELKTQGSFSSVGQLERFFQELDLRLLKKHFASYTYSLMVETEANVYRNVRISDSSREIPSHLTVALLPKFDKRNVLGESIDIENPIVGDDLADFAERVFDACVRLTDEEFISGHIFNINTFHNESNDLCFSIWLSDYYE